MGCLTQFVEESKSFSKFLQLSRLCSVGVLNMGIHKGSNKKMIILYESFLIGSTLAWHFVVVASSDTELRVKVHTAALLNLVQ